MTAFSNAMFPKHAIGGAGAAPTGWLMQLQRCKTRVLVIDDTSALESMAPSIQWHYTQYCRLLAKLNSIRVFPSPKSYRLRTRDLIFPHRTCHLFERRKSHALLLGLIDGDIEAMGFHPTQQPPLRVLQDAMFEDAYAALEAHLFECLRLS